MNTAQKNQKMSSSTWLYFQSGSPTTHHTQNKATRLLLLMTNQLVSPSPAANIQDNVVQVVQFER